MGSLSSDSKLPWIRTPCVLSNELSKIAGCNIYLKYDNLQPSGSFKSRGIGNLMTRSAASSASSGQDKVHFYCSSGGNAGLACATSAIALKKPATIVVPTITSPLMKGKLLALGVEVVQIGRNWAEADKHLREELLANDPNGVYVPPFHHPWVWEGAATIVQEIREQLDQPVHAIVCSVGGGGLVNGIMQGVDEASWGESGKPKVLAVETEGADSLHASVVAGEHITLPEMTSIATSLGATRVSAKTWEWATQEGSVMKSVKVSDADAAISSVRFADDARQLVEVACGATLVPVYNGELRGHLGQGLDDEAWSKKNVVLEVCGGSNITLEMLDEYKKTYASQSSIKV